MDSSPVPKPSREAPASNGRPSLSRKPSLLPAFEPLSSSPLPRPSSSKRKYEEDSPSRVSENRRYYPTPVPTSSTGILPSSPQQSRRPGLQRTISTLSERAPLCALPTIDVPPTGEPVRMGRSSNSSNYQFAFSRLISRVHVQASYQPPDPVRPHGAIFIECLGWNGAKVHCRGQVYSLAKNETFSSSSPNAEIMLDVQDSRVVIAWPPLESSGCLNSDPWTGDSPSRQPLGSSLDRFDSSPPSVHPRSPVSQSPIPQPDFSASATFIASDLLDDASNAGGVQVYEDADAGEEQGDKTAVGSAESSQAAEKSVFQECFEADAKSRCSKTFQSDDFSDNDEENDPIIHSFGPFGENLLPRMASFSAASRISSPQMQRQRQPLKSPSRSPQQAPVPAPGTKRHFKSSPIKNHVINQLAFSRLHSIPLSTISRNLPMELKVSRSNEQPSANDGSGQGHARSLSADKLTDAELKKMLDDIPCVGEISRQGKDAAGKPLENEFYYLPEMDADQMRRDAVTGGVGGTGLRSVRKNHKQYYWKKPRH